MLDEQVRANLKLFFEGIYVPNPYFDLDQLNKDFTTFGNKIWFKVIDKKTNKEFLNFTMSLTDIFEGPTSASLFVFWFRVQEAHKEFLKEEMKQYKRTAYIALAMIVFGLAILTFGAVLSVR